MEKFKAIAIDGPSAAGKGTTAKLLAEKLGFKFISSGAFYRIAALVALQNNISIGDPTNVVEKLEKIRIDFKNGAPFVNDEDVSMKITKHEVSDLSSRISVYPIVRNWVHKIIQYFAQKYNFVIEGRDITTVVLPNADFKFYLDATPEERAKRRHFELQEKGQEISYSQVLEDIRKRDKRDTTREVDPLKIADDAVYIDTTGISINEVVNMMYDAVRKNYKL